MTESSSAWATWHTIRISFRGRQNLVPANLVDETHHVSVGPASLVQVVGLLQHLGQLLAADISVGLAPPLDGGGEEGVAHAEGCGHEHVGGGGVGAHVVAVKVAVLK